MVSGSKGLERGTGKRMSVVLAEELPHAAERLCALSGPNLAREVVRHHPALGDGVQILHAAPRRKARHEAAGEEVGSVTTQDLNEEVERFKRASGRIAAPKSGNYV